MCPFNCICNPCCRRSNPEDFREWVDSAYKRTPNMFDIVYHDNTLGHMDVAPIVGDTIFGYTVWRVDYGERIAYVTK